MTPSLGRGLCRVGVVRWLWRQRSSSAYLQRSVVAGLSKNTGAFPTWWGIADVVLAFVLAAMVFTVMVAARQNKQTSRRRQLPRLSDLDSRNIRDARSVLPSRGRDNLDQLSHWVRLARVAALVCVAFVVYRGENSCS
jgi:hypothetical protein